MFESISQEIASGMHLRLDSLLKIKEFCDRKGIDPSKVIIAYQRIEDVYFEKNGWRTWNFDFRATDEDVEYANKEHEKHGGPKGSWTKESLNNWCDSENGDYILAWGASMHKQGGDWILKIHAHY